MQVFNGKATLIGISFEIGGLSLACLKLGLHLHQTRLHSCVAVDKLSIGRLELSDFMLETLQTLLIFHRFLLKLILTIYELIVARLKLVILLQHFIDLLVKLIFFIFNSRDLFLRLFRLAFLLHEKALVLALHLLNLEGHGLRWVLLIGYFAFQVSYHSLGTVQLIRWTLRLLQQLLLKGLLLFHKLLVFLCHKVRLMHTFDVTHSSNKVLSLVMHGVSIVFERVNLGILDSWEVWISLQQASLTPDSLLYKLLDAQIASLAARHRRCSTIDSKVHRLLDLAGCILKLLKVNLRYIRLRGRLLLSLSCTVA